MTTDQIVFDIRFVLNISIMYLYKLLYLYICFVYYYSLYLYTGADLCLLFLIKMIFLLLQMMTNTLGYYYIILFNVCQGDNNSF